VISVVKEINEPRYPSFMGIRKASKKEIPTWSLADLGLEAGQVGQAGSQVRWPEVGLPPARETKTEIIQGTPAEAAKSLADRLIAEKLI
jgi:electron transfer flavoprotein beta subunit